MADHLAIKSSGFGGEKRELRESGSRASPDIWTKLYESRLKEIIDIQSPEREDVFRRAFKKPEVFDFLDLMLQPSRLGLGTNRYSSQQTEEEKDQDDIADDSEAKDKDHDDESEDNEKDDVKDEQSDNIFSVELKENEEKLMEVEEPETEVKNPIENKNIELISDEKQTDEVENSPIEPLSEKEIANLIS